MPDSPSQDDRGVIPQFLRGDMDAVRVVDGWIEVVLRREFQSIRTEWEDLRQEIRIRLLACLNAGRFNGGSALRTYVHRISRNTGIDYTRKAYRVREKATGGELWPSRGEPVEDVVTSFITRDLLTRILEGLGARDRLVVDLVFAQHLSYKEVAKKLHLTEGAVKSLVFRCRERLLKRRIELLGRSAAGR